MARNRTPKEKAEVSGAALRHPERYGTRQEPQGLRPLGEPYANMTEAQKAVWYECAAEMQWLKGSHRMLLRLACILTVRMDGELGVSAAHALSSVLSKLGATPVDSSKVGTYEEDDKDERDEFFRH